MQQRLKSWSVRSPRRAGAAEVTPARRQETILSGLVRSPDATGTENRARDDARIMPEAAGPGVPGAANRAAAGIDRGQHEVALSDGSRIRFAALDPSMLQYA